MLEAQRVSAGETERCRTSRRSEIQPFLVMQVLAAANARAAAGGDVLHLEVGEPSGGPPALAIEAARTALAGQALGYSEALGLRPLRAAISAHYAATYDVEVPLERIAITAGASGGFILAFLAAFDAGARVALAAPGYPAYTNILKALDIEVVSIPTTAENGFQPTLAELEALQATDRRADHREPGQPDRHGDAGEAARRHRRLVPAPGRAADLRRDLSRHHLRHGADAPRSRRRAMP